MRQISKAPYTVAIVSSFFLIVGIDIAPVVARTAVDSKLSEKISACIREVSAKKQNDVKAARSALQSTQRQIKNKKNNKELANAQKQYLNTIKRINQKYVSSRTACLKARNIEEAPEPVVRHENSVAPIIGIDSAPSQATNPLPLSATAPQYSDEPSLTFTFINGGYSQTEFDNLIKSSIAALANATPLKDCPQQIKALKINTCSSEEIEIGDYAKKYYDKFDAAVLLKPYDKKNDCKGISSRNDSIIIGVADCSKAFVHEVGHALFNFSDQYCYNSSHKGFKLNPATDDKGCGYSPTKREYTCPIRGTCWNRVTKENDRLAGFTCNSNNDCVKKYNDSNYECVSCFVPKEGTFDHSYCSRYNNPPIFCLGNPNKNNNDRSVMGMADYSDNAAFDPNEYSLVQSKIKCKLK